MYSLDGAPVASSSGIVVGADCRLGRFPVNAHVFVCSGTETAQNSKPPVLSALRHHVRFGGKVGAICTGAIALAHAGLLAGKRITLHWENQPAFKEEFPDLDVSTRIFEVADNTHTCGGGAAATDMMLQLIEDDFGRRFSEIVADMCLHGDRRSQQSPQRSSVSNLIGKRSRILAAAVNQMVENIEVPLRLETLARKSGGSRRQVERLFKKYLKCRPSKYYKHLRLDQGRCLLRETDLSVTEIAMACGFSSATQFSRGYRARFDEPPRHTRRSACLG